MWRTDRCWLIYIISVAMTLRIECGDKNRCGIRVKAFIRSYSRVWVSRDSSENPLPRYLVEEAKPRHTGLHILVPFFRIFPPVLRFVHPPNKVSRSFLDHSKHIGSDGRNTCVTRVALTVHGLHPITAIVCLIHQRGTGRRREASRPNRHEHNRNVHRRFCSAIPFSVSCW